MAANHWDLAIETHNTNHPDTDHDTADLHDCDPRRFPKTDIGWFSPECTKWTVASGKAAAAIDAGLWEDPLADEAAQRSRMLMFDVPRFAEHHRYRAVIVENVVDVSTRAQYKPAFERWLKSMHALGYQHREVYLNAMHAQAAGLPAPQSRDRLYVVFWMTGERAPDVERWTRPQAWCDVHGQITAMQSWKNPSVGRGRYRQQYLYRCPQSECRHQVVEPGWLPAASIIDWSLRGTRIGDRSKPLSPKTMARIQAGLDRYGQPFQLEAGGNQYDTMDPKHPRYLQPGGYIRAWPTTDPLKTLHTTESKALVVPVEGRVGKEARLASDALRTMTTRSETGILVMLRGENAPKSTDQVVDTFAASGLHHGLIMRHNEGGAEMVTPTAEYLRTLTTRGHQSLLVPYQSRSVARPTSHPTPTLTTIDPAGLLVPAGGTWNDTAYPTTEAMRARTTREAEALVVSQSSIEDCEFRMLEPSEIKRGMAFPTEYVMLGNRREQVKLAGNAVCPPAARDLVAAVAESLAGAA